MGKFTFIMEKFIYTEKLRELYSEIVYTHRSGACRFFYSPFTLPALFYLCAHHRGAMCLGVAAAPFTFSAQRIPRTELNIGWSGSFFREMFEP